MDCFLGLLHSRRHHPEFSSTTSITTDRKPVYCNNSRFRYMVHMDLFFWFNDMEKFKKHRKTILWFSCKGGLYTFFNFRCCLIGYRANVTPNKAPQRTRERAAKLTR